MTNRLEKRLWTVADFETMGWHDARIWGMAFSPEAYEFILDIDYIVEWIAPSDGTGWFKFWTVPATLVFENVYDLRIEVEPFADVSIDDLSRSEPMPHGSAGNLGTEETWLWSLELHVGSISFRGTGYRQFMRGNPVLNSTQYLPLQERGGLSFARDEHL